MTKVVEDAAGVPRQRCRMAAGIRAFSWNGSVTAVTERFGVWLTVRSYELDRLGHVNHAVYHQYGEHARLELLRAAGCSLSRLVEAGMGIVLLDTHVRFLAELRMDDEVWVSCVPRFGAGKTFALDSTISTGKRGVSADVECTMGLLDLEVRRLLNDPLARLAELAERPELLTGYTELAVDAGAAGGGHDDRTG